MSKYRAVKTKADGATFDSKAEARRYEQLKILQKAGHIQDLRIKPAFILAPSVKYEGAARYKPALRYIADFSYTENGVQIVEDVKGVQTQVFKIKRHLMKSSHGIEVRLTK